MMYSITDFFAYPSYESMSFIKREILIIENSCHVCRRIKNYAK